MIALRSSLLLLLLLLMMRPVVVVPSIIPRSTSLAMVLDNSRSMSLKDEGNLSRLDAVKQLLSPETKFSKYLDSKFKIDQFSFSNSTERINSPTSLNAQGTISDIAGALDNIENQSSGKSLSAVVLISDGGANTSKDISSQLRELRAKNIPVFTIGVGNPDKFKDVEMMRAVVPRKVLTGSAVIADLTVRSSGYNDTKATITVYEDGRPFKTQQVDLKISGGGESTRNHNVIIEFMPTSPGPHRYSFEIKPLDGETTTENNLQDTLLEVTNDNPKVLYLEGEPRWEYGFIRKAFSKNEKNLVLVSVNRTAEGKFYRQGIESGSELTKGFPLTEEELYSYKGLVLGSVEAGFFSYEQLKLIEQFAAKRGGGVLMIGGKRAFDGGKYANSPIADLLPVVLNDRVDDASEDVSNYKATLTTRGKTHAITRFNEDRNLSERAWNGLPAVTIPESFTQIKPGATIIAEARNTNNSSRTLPLIIDQRYGRGRSMALTANDTWRWRMEQDSQVNHHETFWRQMLRFLVSTVPDQYEVLSEKDVYGPGEQVAIHAETANKKFDPITDAKVIAKITKPSGSSFDLPLNLVYSEDNVNYRNTFTPDEQGLYKIDMTSLSKNGESGLDQSTFFVTNRTREFYDASQNVELLKRIAAETGGQYFPLNKADDLLDEITMLEGKNSERISKDLWDMPINFLLLIGLAGAEWFLRKHKGLA